MWILKEVRLVEKRKNLWQIAPRMFSYWVLETGQTGKQPEREPTKTSAGGDSLTCLSLACSLQGHSSSLFPLSFHSSKLEKFFHFYFQVYRKRCRDQQRGVSGKMASKYWELYHSKWFRNSTFQNKCSLKNKDFINIEKLIQKILENKGTSGVSWGKIGICKVLE